MGFRAVDPEIEETTVRTGQFGPDARIGRLQPARVQRRPPTSNALGKTNRPGGIHGVILFLNPFDIRPETRLPRQVQGQMHAQAARFGHRVNQRVERVSAAVAEIDTPGQPLLGLLAVGKPAPVPRQPRRSEPSGIDHPLRHHRARHLATHLQNVPAGCRIGTRSQHRSAAHELTTVIFQLTEQRQHQSVAVDDAGFRTPQRRPGGHRRNAGSQVPTVNQFECHAVVGGPGLDAGQLGQLGIGGRDDPFATLAVADLVGLAVVVQALPPGHAQPGLQGRLRIVDASVNHLAVAGGYPFAETRPGLQHDHLLAGHGQFPGDR